MSSCQPTIVLWMLFGVVLSMVAVAQSIGANPLTCITFDLPRWDGKFKDSRGGYLNINNVEKTSCTVAGNKCGLFKASSRVKIPSFNGNSFYDLSASIWFKRSPGFQWTDMTLILASKCHATPIILYSKKHGHAVVAFVKTTAGSYNLHVNTPNQISDFVHVVVTFSASKVDESGQMKIYINGNLAGQKTIQGKILPLPGPLILGSDPDCGGRYDFRGQMESVSLARTELSASDVKALYNSPGSCIGG